MCNSLEGQLAPNFNYVFLRIIFRVANFLVDAVTCLSNSVYKHTYGIEIPMARNVLLFVVVGTDSI